MRMRPIVSRRHPHRTRPRPPPLCYKPAMATPPRKDNVVRFNKSTRPNGGTNGSRPPTRDWRAMIRGREGLVGLVVIVVLAVAIVVWRRVVG